MHTHTYIHAHTHTYAHTHTHRHQPLPGPGITAMNAEQLEELEVLQSIFPDTFEGTLVPGRAVC